MRPIKFRAWDKKYTIMLDPEAFNRNDIWIGGDGSVYEIEEWSGYSGGGKIENNVSDQYVLMQYIGLRDSKRTEKYPEGQRIYEGDVFPPGERTHGEVTIVCYDSKQARYKAVPLSLYKSNAGNGGWTGYEVNPYSEVIGNIYQNKELIS